MSEYTHRTIIVPERFQQLAQGLCEAAADGDAGKGMFTTGLSATGELPATHYISSGFIFDSFADLLPCTVITDEGAVTRPCNVAVIEALAAHAGLPVPGGAIPALIGAVDVSEQGPWGAMERLGLSIVHEAVPET